MQAMKLAIEWIKKYQGYHEIVLTYKVGNEIAKRFYTELGFKQMSGILDDEVDMVMTY